MKTRNCVLKMINLARPDVLRLEAEYEVSFQWKNPDFLLNNVDFIIKQDLLRATPPPAPT